MGNAGVEDKFAGIRDAIVDRLGTVQAAAEPEAYERALGEHLAGLACGEVSNRYVARGVARRGLFNGGGETVARVLASALLGEDCRGYGEYLTSLGEEERERGLRRLERLATPDADAGDG